jgi:hypothetical protein
VSETGSQMVKVDLPDGEVREVTLEDAAAELVALAPDVAEAQAIIARHEAFMDALAANVKLDTPVPAGDDRFVTLVRTGGKRQVNKGVCATWEEKLLRAGVVERVTPTDPPPPYVTSPKVSDLTEATNRAKLLALGVPVDELITVSGGKRELVVTDLNEMREAA